MRVAIPTNLTQAAFFFIDIVGLSSPDISTETQTTKIKILNKSISECNTFKSFPKDRLLFSSTGDGMVIGFRDGLEQPIHLALELNEKLKQYNKDQPPTNVIQVRIGCHSDIVFLVDDIYGRPNLWGPGIILARRVMDLGDAGHILMTSAMAEGLLELSDDYKEIIHPLHDCQIKHDQIMFVYSVYGENFGNPSKPKRGLVQESKIVQKAKEMQQTMAFKNIEYNLVLKDTKKNLVKHIRTYHFVNKSSEPIHVAMGIITNVEKNFADLNVRAVDEKGKELKIAGINLDTPKRKEFTIKLDEPVFSTDGERRYTIEYLVEEPKRSFENVFLINSEKLHVTFDFPAYEDIKEPKLYTITNHTGEKKLLKVNYKANVGLRTQLRWKKEDGIFENDMIRLEW